MYAAIMLDDTPDAIPGDTGTLCGAAKGSEEYAASEAMPFASIGEVGSTK